MKRLASMCGYAALGGVVIFVDRLTKAYALRHFVTPCVFNWCLSAELAFNRGISWNMLTFDDQRFFMFVSCLVMVVTLLLAIYAMSRLYHGHRIIGETLVFAGSCSNVADRFLYGGVIDFILISYKSWAWPVFNIADACIVTGVVIMCLQTLTEDAA